MYRTTYSYFVSISTMHASILLEVAFIAWIYTALTGEHVKTIVLADLPRLRIHSFSYDHLEARS